MAQSGDTSIWPFLVVLAAFFVMGLLPRLLGIG